jgi:hypothetical protein
MALVTEVLSEVTTKTGTTQMVLVYDTVTREVKELLVEGKGDPNTECQVVLRNPDLSERESKTVKGSDATLNTTGLSMKQILRRGKLRWVPDFPRPEFRTATTIREGVLRTGP